MPLAQWHPCPGLVYALSGFFPHEKEFWLNQSGNTDAIASVGKHGFVRNSISVAEVSTAVFPLAGEIVRNSKRVAEALFVSSTYVIYCRLLLGSAAAEEIGGTNAHA